MPGCQTWTASDISWYQMWTPSSVQYYSPSFPNITINSANQATVSLVILINLSKNANAISDTTFGTESQFTMPLTLLPNTSIEVAYSVMQITYLKNAWFNLIPGTWSCFTFSSRMF